MKKIWKLALAITTLIAFTACGNEENTVSESEAIESTEELDTDLNTEMEEDTSVFENNDIEGIIEEEEPPVQ
jgi:hypothetical protein